MMRIALSIATLAAVLCFGVRPGQAGTYGEAPWCAVVETGGGGVERDCEYFSIEECSPNVIAGNRGICQMNPYYRGAPAPAGYPRRGRYRHRHRPYH